VRLFADEIDERLPYWLVCRPEALRQPTVLAFIEALRGRIAAVEDELLGRPGTAQPGTAQPGTAQPGAAQPGAAESAGAGRRD